MLEQIAQEMMKVAKSNPIDIKSTVMSMSSADAMSLGRKFSRDIIVENVPLRIHFTYDIFMNFMIWRHLSVSSSLNIDDYPKVVENIIKAFFGDSKIYEMQSMLRPGKIKQFVEVCPSSSECSEEESLQKLHDLITKDKNLKSLLQPYNF